MPGTDSNSGRCSLLYHSLNSGACWGSISTYTIKIPRPFCAMFPASSVNVAVIVLPRLVGARSSRLEPGETRDPNWGPSWFRRQDHAHDGIRGYTRVWQDFTGHRASAKVLPSTHRETAMPVYEKGDVRIR